MLSWLVDLSRFLLPSQVSLLQFTLRPLVILIQRSLAETCSLSFITLTHIIGFQVRILEVGWPRAYMTFVAKVICS